jgi:shikimate 5-dehydrogenase
MRKEFKFETPELFLIVTKDKKDSGLEKVFQKGLDLLDNDYALLPISIQKKNLKNMLTAIKLMDVKGAFIADCYRDKPKAFADTISSRNPVNTVVLKGKKYHGHNTLQTAYRSQLKTVKNIKTSSISIFGSGDQLDCLVGEIEQLKPKELNIFRGPALKGKKITYSNINIVCGPTSFKVPLNLAAKVSKDSSINLIDMREGIVSYPKEIATQRRNVTKNTLFLTHLASATIKLWTNKIIEIEDLRPALSHICVK